MTPYYEENGIAIYHGDCRDVLSFIPECDALITDPPYGVKFTGKLTKNGKETWEEVYTDSDDYFEGVTLPSVNMALALCKRAAIFSGISKLHQYPKPADIGGVVCPAGSGRSPWGFGCYNPVLFYGNSPYAGRASYPTTVVMTNVRAPEVGHPCPKPLAFTNWIVNMASLVGETVLDPFTGSGSVLRSAKILGRRAIGIEINERYCEIAARLLGQETLYVETVKSSMTCETLF